MLHYDEVQGKSAEEILRTAGGTAAGGPVDGVVGEYYRLAAQVRSTQELIEALKKASASSDALSTRVFRLNCVLVWLTLALVFVGLSEALGTAWPYLAWWWQHR